MAVDLRKRTSCAEIGATAEEFQEFLLKVCAFTCALKCHGQASYLRHHVLLTSIYFAHLVGMCLHFEHSKLYVSFGTSSKCRICSFFSSRRVNSQAYRALKSQSLSESLQRSSRCVCFQFTSVPRTCACVCVGACVVCLCVSVCILKMLDRWIGSTSSVVARGPSRGMRLQE